MATAEINAKIQIDGLQGVKKALSSLSDSMEETKKATKDIKQSLKDTGESIKGFGDKVKGAGESMMIVTGAIAGFATGAIVAANDIEGSLKGVQNATGANEKQMAKYEKSIKNVAKTGVGSFEEVGSAATSLLDHFGDMDSISMESMTEESMALAKMMDEDVNEVLRTASVLSTQFGIAGTEALDMVAKGYQSGGNASGDMLDTLKEYSVHFKDGGYSAEGMFNSLINGAKGGAFTVDKVGDAVKEFGLLSREVSDDADEAFKQLGISPQKFRKEFAKGGEAAKGSMDEVVKKLNEVDNEIERNALGVQLFGTMYEDLGHDAVVAMTSAEDHMKGFMNTANEVANNKTFEEKMLGVWNELKIAMEPVGEVLKELVVEYLPPLIAKITELSKWFTELSPAGQKTVLMIAGLVALIGPVLLGIASIINVVGGAITMLAGLGATVAIVGKVLLFVFSGGAIIAALAALVYLVVKYWDEIVAFLGKALGWIGDLFSGAFTWIMGFLKEHGMKIAILIGGPVAWAIALIVKHWDAIKQAFVDAYTKIKEAVLVFFTWYKEKTINNFNEAKNKALEIWTGLIEGARERFEKVKNAIVKPINKAKELVGKAIEKIKNIMNFDFKLPKLKMPHFNMKGKFSLSPPSVPKLGVDWYATGGIATGPSVVGIGEAGDEAILPLSNKKRMKPFADTVAGMIAQHNNPGQNDDTGGKTIITGNTFVVREEADVKRVAQELHKLNQKNKRPKGRRG